MALFKSVVSLPGKDTEFGRASEAFDRDLVKLGLRIMDQTAGVLIGTRRKNIDAEWKVIPGYEPGIAISAGVGIVVFPTPFPRALVALVAWSPSMITLSYSNTDLTQFEFRRIGGGPGIVDVTYLAVGY